MRTKSSLLLAFLLSFAVACGGDDGGDDGAGNGGNEADASVDTPDSGGGGGEADAGVTGATALGQECTPTPDNCPEGHICLPFGGTNPWCGFECPTITPGSNAGCEGYEGPGAARCAMGVDTDGDGSADFNTCAIVCNDTTGGICQDGDVCDGTCPHGLACEATGQGYSICQ